MARQKASPARPGDFRVDDDNDPDRAVNYWPSGPDRPITYWLSFYGPAKYWPTAGAQTRYHPLVAATFGGAVSA